MTTQRSKIQMLGNETRKDGHSDASKTLSTSSQSVQTFRLTNVFVVNFFGSDQAWRGLESDAYSES